MNKGERPQNLSYMLKRNISSHALANNATTMQVDLNFNGFLLVITVECKNME